MKAEAIEKIKQEIKSNKGNRYVEVVGTFLLGYIEQHEGFAEHVMKKGKTIQNSIKAMQEVARKKQKNGVAVLTDEEGFEVVVQYFTAEDKKKEQMPKEETAEQSKQQDAEKGEQEVFKRNCWYHHPESDAYLAFKKGDSIPDDADFELCRRITKKEYDEGIAQQDEVEDDLDDLL